MFTFLLGIFCFESDGGIFIMEVVKKLWKLCIRNVSPEICLHNLTGLLYHLGEVLSNSTVWNKKNKILFTYRFPGDPKYSLTKSEFSNGKGIFWCNEVLEMISTNSSLDLHCGKINVQNFPAGKGQQGLTITFCVFFYKWLYVQNVY